MLAAEPPTTSEQPHAAPSRFVFVSGLPPTTTARDLGQHLATAGAIEKVDLRVDAENRAVGTAFVAFVSPEDAAAAMRAFHKSTFGGRTIQLRRDRTAGQGSNVPKKKPAAPRAASIPGAQRKKRTSITAATHTDDEALLDDHRDAVDEIIATHMDNLALNDEQADLGIRTNVLWVGNLPFTARWHDIKRLVTERTEGCVTPLRVELATDRETGKPRGHASVTLANLRDAQLAARALQGLEMGHPPRRLVVSADRRHGDVDSCVFVRNVPFSSSWLRVKSLFEHHGLRVVRVHMAPPMLNLQQTAEAESGGEHSHQNLHRGYGTVVLTSPDEAARAVQALQHAYLDGRRIDVRPLDLDLRGQSRRNHQQQQRQQQVSPPTTSTSEEDQDAPQAQDAESAATPATPPETDPDVPTAFSDRGYATATRRPGRPGMGGNPTTTNGYHASASAAGNHGNSGWVYIGNIDWQASWQDLKDRLRAVIPATTAIVGKVELAIDYATQRSRGYALVQMHPPRTNPTILPQDLVAQCVHLVNGTEFHGRLLVAQPDRSRRHGGPGVRDAPPATRRPSMRKPVGMGSARPTKSVPKQQAAEQTNEDTENDQEAQKPQWEAEAQAPAAFVSEEGVTNAA